MTSPASVGAHVRGRITLAEAAERLGVHRETLRRWAKTRLITFYAYPPGHYMEFDVRDIEAFEEASRHARSESPSV
jgi:excisionase family DNA binding protein